MDQPMDQPLFSEILIPLDESESPEVIEERRKRCEEIAQAYWEKHGHRCFDDESVEDHQRHSRGIATRNFRTGYKFVQGKKICISSEGISLWSDKCYDSTWVVVHGMESVCMVTWRRDVDMTRVEPYYQHYCTNQQTMRSYAEAVITEVESLPYDDDVRERFGHSIEKPFGVVSVVPDTKKVDEESGNEALSAEYDEEKAMAFLKKKMTSGLAFTFEETVQTAISGFQHLCPEVLKAEDIWVTTLNIAKNWFEHMHLDQRKEHLAVISSGSLGGL